MKWKEIEILIYFAILNRKEQLTFNPYYTPRDVESPFQPSVNKRDINANQTTFNGLQTAASESTINTIPTVGRFQDETVLYLTMTNGRILICKLARKDI